MYGLNFIIRNTMKVSFFIDKNDEFYHWSFLKGFNYDLSDEEWDLINQFGKNWLIKTVKEMNVYETRELNNYIKLMRFQ